MSREPVSTADLRGERRETCLLVSVELRAERQNEPAGEGAFDSTAEESLQELAELAEGAGAEVLGATTQVREKADPATLAGRGKIDEIKRWAQELDVDFVLFDQPLSPSQQRNLERALDRRVLDRTQLILDIFARHARTREGKLQVELAQLSYMLPRLAGRGAAMSRLGGGIGTRGPGETKLETDRRRISRRIDKLEEELEKVRATRELQRKKRTAVPLSTVALAGYTNAGKSTLFNTLTASEVLADKKMFATLDPTIRVLELPSRRRVLLSDTVGFIRNLPTTLVKAFRATLEEVVESAMILHVVDAASPHRREQMQQVDRLLNDLGARGKPQVLVLNKCDLVGPEAARAFVEAERGAGNRSGVVAISAREREGLDELARTIEACLPADPLQIRRFRFPHDRGDLVSFLYQNARVLERRDEEGAVEVVAEASESVSRRLDAYAVAE